VGIFVPKSTIERAVRYVKQSYIQLDSRRGAFQYQIDPDYPAASAGTPSP